MAVVFINIGSNLGNRRLNLSRAMRAIGECFGDFEMSHVVESKPLGFDSTNDFLNIGIAFNSDLEPHELLAQLKDIEKRLGSGSHRTPEGDYCDRLIDIDIVAIDDKVIDDEHLTVPHKHLAERDFFLVPMEELAAMWRHPLTGKTASEMLAELETEEK